MQVIKRLLGGGCERHPSSFDPVVNPLEQFGISQVLAQEGLSMESERRRLARIFIDEVLDDIEKGKKVDTSNLITRFKKFRERNPLEENEECGYLTLGLVWGMVEGEDLAEHWEYLRNGGEPEDYNTLRSTLVDLLYDMADEQGVRPWELKGFEATTKK